MHRAFPYTKKDKQTYFVAEIGSNHNNNELRLINLIYKAKDSGFDAIKLQYFDPNKLWDSRFIQHSNIAHQRALPFKFLQTAFDICIQEDISLGCSVFDIAEVQIVAEYCNFLKIASYESQWTELISECLSTELPLFVSTGMCSLMEIYDTWELIKNDPDNVLFHCMSQYPYTGDHCIDHFSNIFNSQLPDNQFGYSDHTVNPSTITTAIEYGAKVIECHMDLDDRQGWEYNHNHCWTASELKKCIKANKNTKRVYHDTPAVNKSMEKILGRPDRHDFILRTDPIDGSRPLILYRESLLGRLNDK